MHKQVPITFFRRVAVPPCSPSSITAYRDCVGMSDGKRLSSSLDLLKRHYPQVASLQDYIWSILSNATEITLVDPDDPEEYRDLLEDSRVGYHQLPCQKYRAGAPVFEIDEVGVSTVQSLLSTYARLGHQKITVVPPPCSMCREKRHYRWLQGVPHGTSRVRFSNLPHRRLTWELLSTSRDMG